MSKKLIAVFDMAVITSSPIGSCVLKLVTALADEYEFVVFADQFENPYPEKITWIRVTAPQRPIFLRYMVFHYSTAKAYQKFLRDSGRTPDLLLGTEGEFLDCDICYVQYCNKAYMKRQTARWTSLRAVARSVTRRFNRYTEARVFSKAKVIVTPSSGLSRELVDTYGSQIEHIERKIVKISNPVDVEKFIPPESLDIVPLRRNLGLTLDENVLVFAALGDFERKGLRFILEALATLQDADTKLLVVGGTPSEIQEYEKISQQLKVSEHVKFIGFQSDIRPYLWLADLFVFPSEYETFSLVSFQAALAGLPVMATQLYGVEDFLKPGVNGWLIERSTHSIVDGLKEAISSRQALKQRGVQAQRDATEYDVPTFIQNWRSLLHLTLE